MIDYICVSLNAFLGFGFHSEFVLCIITLDLMF